MNGVEQHGFTDIDVRAGDLQRVLEAAAVARSFLESFEKPDLPLLLFHAIVEITLEQGKQGVPLEKLEFESKELSDYITRHFHTFKKFGEQDDDERTKWITGLWKKLSGRLADFEPGLIQIAIRKQCDVIPVPTKNESTGGRGNRTSYKLKFALIPDADNSHITTPLTLMPEQSQQPVSPDANQIVYTTTRAGKIPLWARWLDHFELSGYKRYGFLVPLMICFVLCSVWGFISVQMLINYWLHQPIALWQFKVFYPGMMIILPIANVIYPFLRISSHKIVPSPFFLTFFQSVTHDLFLELSRADGRHRIDPDKPRSIRLVSYSARCPVCNGFVSIEGGGWKYPGRLIGRCYESPREHVWSFDHVTLSGRRLH